MRERPEVRPGDWVIVGTVRSVVSSVRAPGDEFGDCEVVCNPSKPANRDVKWDGNAWAFVETGDGGGYADKYPRLKRYVAILKRGT